MAGEGVKVTVSVPESELGKTEEGDSERASASAGIDAAKAEAQSKAEFQSKYGMKKKPPGFSQKKLSTGGRQYFDSGDYMQANRKERKEIAAHPHVMKEIAGHPHAMNPAVAHLRAKSSLPKATPSPLAQ